MTARTLSPVCRCPYESKRPWLDGSAAVCARCDRRLSETAQRVYHHSRRLTQEWRFGHPTGIYRGRTIRPAGL